MSEELPRLIYRRSEPPDVLSLEQAARSCGQSHAWAREKAGGGELPLLPLLPGHEERRVGKLALLGGVVAGGAVAAGVRSAPVLPAGSILIKGNDR